MHHYTEELLDDNEVLFNHNPVVPPDEEEAARWLAKRTVDLLYSVEGVGERIEIKDPFTGEIITFGTLDVWGYDDDGKITLIDWKTGYPDEYSAQLSVYALGLMDKLEKDEVEAYILYGDHKRQQYYHINRAGAEYLINRILTAREDANAPYVKNKYCSRCAVRPNCPAWNEPAEFALAVAGTEDLAFKEGLDIVVKDPERLAKFIKGWRCLAKLVEDHNITAKAIEFLESGVPVGNYEVKERKGRRSYTSDSVKTMLELVRAELIDIDEAAIMFSLDPKGVDKYYEEKGKPCPLESIVKGMFKILVEKQ